MTTADLPISFSEARRLALDDGQPSLFSVMSRGRRQDQTGEYILLTEAVVRPSRYRRGQLEVELRFGTSYSLTTPIPLNFASIVDWVRSQWGRFLETSEADFQGLVTRAYEEAQEAGAI